MQSVKKHSMLITISSVWVAEQINAKLCFHRTVSWQSTVIGCVV